ncbi:chemotaxis protein CheA [Plastorhodobacter daqingensis]|uniref:Chemotaxis protein CheA n=1 Tax=Plastorhodobacter daqingensis TaxID=1387281 RepID=A0ABW2UG31_9RHOB
MVTAAETPSQAGGGDALLRVSSEKIARLMDLVGELSLCMAQVLAGTAAALDDDGFQTRAHRLGMILREVQDAAVELRLVPLDEVFRRLRRMVRELERQTGKKIELLLSGEDTPIDKVVADRLYDPLLHVLRNAADHGLEPPDERRAAGKPETGIIRLSAQQIGSEVRITVADDGRGLRRDKILARARDRGFFGADEEPEDGALWRVILEPGFSTAETVSNLSGRGVGMDVLNTTMRDLRGRIAVDSTAGAGTEVGLFIPVSLAFLDCIIMRQGRRLFATPIDVVAEILQPRPGMLIAPSAGDGIEMVRIRDAFVPLCRLDLFYAHPETACRVAEPGPVPILMVFTTSKGPVAVPVDEVLDRQQVVMKPLTGPLAQVRASWGCALLGSGEIALVLDAERLWQGAGR